mgnify:CR=1 FL=1
MDITEIVTLIIALWGPILSTYQLIESGKEKLRIATVTLKQGYAPAINSELEEMLILTVANPGNRTLTINKPIFELPDKSILVFHPTGSTARQYPYELLEGKNCLTWIEIAEVAKVLQEKGFSGKVKLRGIVTDAVGNKFVSKSVPITIGRWLKN